MQQWQDKGIVLSAAKYGEKSALVDVLTQKHGRQKGMVKTINRQNSPVWQCGNFNEVEWSARLEEHLGNYVGDIITSYAGKVMTEAILLDGINAMCAVLEIGLPEREAVPELFVATLKLLDFSASGEAYEKPLLWAAEYAKWEVALLAELGFAMDLSKCALTGQTDNLAFVSPKTGRAVAKDAAGEWADRLLPLPEFLIGGNADLQNDDVSSALALSGYFLSKCLFGGKIPPARQRFVSRIATE